MGPLDNGTYRYPVARSSPNDLIYPSSSLLDGPVILAMLGILLGFKDC